MSDLIDRDAAIDFIDAGRLCNPNEPRWSDNEVVNFLKSMPSAQPQLDEWCDDCAEMKQEFLRMASFIDCLLECSDDDKETLLGFISRLAEYMPWTERD